MPKLKGRKALLRPYRREDQRHITQWANDPDTTRFLSTFFWLPYTEKNAENFVDMMMSGGDKQIGFVIADPETEDYLGQIDLLQVNWRCREAIIGIVLAKESSRNHGVGGEALRLLCDYAFTTLGLNRLSIDVYAGNPRARRCYEKAGFIQEGVKREAIWAEGHYEDIVNLGMLRSDWLKLREGEDHV